MHWKKLINPDYMGSYMFDNDVKEIIGTIAKVKNESVANMDGKREDCIVAHFKEKELKPLILNRTNCKTISKLFKTPHIEDWEGRSIAMVVKQVKAFGDVVDAIRIKPEIPKVAVTPKCTDCNADIQGDFGKTAKWMAEYTQGKYGKPLCSACAKKASVNKLEDDKKATNIMAEMEQENE